MYIAPNGTIKILHDVPLDNTYQHTLYFASAAAQQSWFNNRVKYTLQNQYYTRLNRGIIRVAVLADNIYDCNYVMYQNTGFGNKWFYAFITSVEYINNEVAEIRFEIDVIQTWLFEFHLQPCFIERMHTATDNIGENIAPEGLELGEYLFPDGITKDDITDDLIIIAAVTDTQSATDGSTYYGGVFSGSTLYAFNPTDEIGINTFLSSYNTRPDAITSMYVAPKNFIVGTVPQGGKKLSSFSDVMAYNFEILSSEALTANKTINGYTPHNKKLYTYPYNFFRVFTPTGNKMTMRYEFCDNLTPSLVFGCTVLLPVQLIARPMNYKGFGTDPGDIQVVLDNYPMCSWAVDTYTAWAAQNSIPIGLDAMTSIVDLGVGVAMGGIGIPGALTSVLDTTKNILKEQYAASIAPDMLKGTSCCGNVSVAMREHSFYYGRMCITSEYAKMIDNYFDMFGYAIKEIKQPVFKNRTYWTYVKTVGCVLDGSVPADDGNKICKIHDSGVCWWDAVNCASNNVNIGNYLVAANNRPLTP